uniref:SUN domain-containing protein n=1 Tax=Caenorhabditis tropicalis TaxID=1561998 RepID=A0A1I7UD97_9PELO
MSSKIEETFQIVANLQIQFDKLSKSSVGESSECRQAEPVKKENDELIEKPNGTFEKVKPLLINKELKNQGTESEEILYKNSIYKINSASYMFGASVDTSYSSSSDLSGESDLVLLDRPNPPANRAWCSDENEPVLTVNLANYIKPTAVSYQHFKWNGTVPYGSPRVFDVFACLDFDCENTEPLITNCEYKSSGQIQEQIYPIPSNLKIKSIVKVQFRFLKNHGNVNKTCVSLVRVYGESTDLPKMREYKEVKSTKTCSALRNGYHNSPFYYDKLEYKTCGYLFWKGCCSVCPECCDDCYIDDYTGFYVIASILLFFLVLGLVTSFLIWIFIFIDGRCKRRNSIQNERAKCP